MNIANKGDKLLFIANPAGDKNLVLLEIAMSDIEYKNERNFNGLELNQIAIIDDLSYRSNLKHCMQLKAIELSSEERWILVTLLPLGKKAGIFQVNWQDMPRDAV